MEFNTQRYDSRVKHTQCDENGLQYGITATRQFTKSDAQSKQLSNYEKSIN